VNKYVCKARVRNIDGTYANVSVPIEAANAGAAREVLRQDLDRQVTAHTLISYGAISVRSLKQ
jgi:hypothetical protein